MYIRRGVIEMEKTKLQLYLPPDDYIFIYNYAVNKGMKNLSHAMSKIIVEYKRFKAIAMKLQQQIDQDYKEKHHGVGTIDKTKRKN